MEESNANDLDKQHPWPRDKWASLKTKKVWGEHNPATRVPTRIREGAHQQAAGNLMRSPKLVEEAKCLAHGGTPCQLEQDLPTMGTSLSNIVGAASRGTNTLGL